MGLARWAELAALAGDRPLEEIGDEGCNRRALGAGQSDMGKERMAFEGLYYRDDSIMATDSQVIALGNIVGEDDPRALADAREDCQENSALERLSLIDDHKGIME